MEKKVIALGSKLMMDDAVAIFVAEKIKKKLNDMDIEVIIGETDVDFCISRLNAEDEFYIMDSTCFGNPPGSITIKPLADIEEIKPENIFAHSLNLFHIINLHRIPVQGFFIGIEVFSITEHFGLSSILKCKLDSICDTIFKKIIS